MKDFVLYPEALALKELGFDEPCFGYFHDGKLSGVNKWDRKDWEFHIISNKDITNTIHEIVLAPTYSQAFRWFREKHDLKISFSYWNGYNGFISEKMAYRYECYVIPQNGMSIVVRGKEGNVYFKNYEEAELACLQKLIEIVKNKEK